MVQITRLQYWDLDFSMAIICEHYLGYFLSMLTFLHHILTLPSGPRQDPNVTL